MKLTSDGEKGSRFLAPESLGLHRKIEGDIFILFFGVTSPEMREIVKLLSYCDFTSKEDF